MNQIQEPGTGGDEPFQVDLRGLVDLLGQHLYSSPRVFVRELVQNGVDAVAQRSTPDTSGRPAVRLVGSDASPDGLMRCLDSGTGLGIDDLRTFLSTIGRSSKRDQLGLARTDLLGQFGIGLLSCFMVSEAIEVTSRVPGEGDPRFVRWTGRSDGNYTVEEDVEPDAVAAEWLAMGSGTVVALRPERGREHWLTTASLLDLATHYASWLPQRVEVAGPEATTAVSPTTLPWQLDEPAARQAAMREQGTRMLCVPPFHSFPVTARAAGLQGVAHILGVTAHAGRTPGHEVHVKGMLVGEHVTELLPDWAFFVRCAVDATGLRPTASREALYDDELLDEVRTELGGQVRRWLLRTARHEPQRMANFLAIHDLAMKAMALDDDELLTTLLPLVRVETNQGPMALQELLDGEEVVHVAPTVEDFHQLAAVAGAQGMTVANGGHVYAAELLQRGAAVLGRGTVEVMRGTDLAEHAGLVDEERLAAVRPVLVAARRTLDELGCQLELRTFAPATMPALYLASTGSVDAGLGTEADEAGEEDPWGAILGALGTPQPDPARLLLNDANPQVRRIVELPDTELAAVAITSLYARSLLQGQHPVRSQDRAAMDHSLDALLDRALSGRRPTSPDPTSPDPTSPEPTSPEPSRPHPEEKR